MKKNITNFLSISILFSLFFFGISISPGINFSKLGDKNTVYYIVSNVISPDNHTFSFSNKIDEIYNKNIDYNIIKADIGSGTFQVSISCLTCSNKDIEALRLIESNSFAQLLAKLQYPDSLITVADESGYRFNAYKYQTLSSFNGIFSRK